MCMWVWIESANDRAQLMASTTPTTGAAIFDLKLACPPDPDESKLRGRMS